MTRMRIEAEAEAVARTDALIAGMREAPEPATPKQTAEEKRNRAYRRRQARGVWKAVCRKNNYRRGSKGVTLSAVILGLERKGDHR